MIKQLLDKMKTAMTDNQGIFQGGRQNRLFGRFGDKIDDFNKAYKMRQDASPTGFFQPGTVGGEGGFGTEMSRAFGLQDVDPIRGTDTMQNLFMKGDPRLNQEFVSARKMGLNFNPSDSNDVRQLQENLIAAGYMPPGSDDGVLGPQTESALRMMQGHMSMSDPTGLGGVENNEGLLGYTNFMNNPPSVANMPMESAPMATGPEFGPKTLANSLGDNDLYGMNTMQPAPINMDAMDTLNRLNQNVDRSSYPLPEPEDKPNFLRMMMTGMIGNQIFPNR